MTIQESFEDFDERHPEVYRYLVDLCYLLWMKGWRRYGIGALWERLRWHFQVELDLGEEFKLNNNYRSRYARRIMEEHPDFRDFFEIRELRAA